MVLKQNYFPLDPLQTYQSRFLLQKAMRLKSSFSKYDVDEGFEQPHSNSEPVIELNRQLAPGYILPNPQQKTKSRFLGKKQDAKLRFISIQRQNNRTSHYDSLKEEQQSSIHKSMTLNKEEQSFLSVKKRSKLPHPSSKLPPLESFANTVSKIKRSSIGENFQFNQFNSLEVKQLKQNLVNKGASLVFQDKRECNSHGFFKKLLKIKNCSNFLKSKYNASLLQKLMGSFINPKNEIPAKLSQITPKKALQFVSDFQSSNLDFVTQINPFQYDIYIKADTNTMGHQNWFYFKLLNNSEETKNLFINVCNLKRGFKMIRKGQKIFCRHKKINKTSLRTSIQTEQDQWSEWQKIQDEITITTVYQNCANDSNRKRRFYKLSFSCNLISETEYEFSLLPPFTYSEVLTQIQNIENTCKYAEVETLTFSLLGLCIPIVTFTNRQSSNQKKNVVLISSRIHPGETCASYVSKGILDKLSEQNFQNDEFLSNHIIKIIPMINPDGVVLGNFRTNYLGNDLNRSFNQQNEVTFPQICGLKELGRKLKQQYKQRFLCFLDLHGHSSQKSIFTYGPNYEENHKNFFNSRFFPKTLSHLAEQFNYDKCTFTLQECKTNTARGYFLKVFKTMAYTIESSYALFDSNKQPYNKNQDLMIQNWINFGYNIIKALEIWNKSNKNSKLQGLKNEDPQNLKQITISEKTERQDYLVIGKIRKQLAKQTSNLKKKIRKRKNSQNDEQSSADDTDGQSDSEDIPFRQREKLQRKLVQVNNNANLFPRILRPAIIHPEVNPPLPLFSVSKINPTESTAIKGSIINARMKKNRYQNVKSVSVNNAYTEYLLKEVKGLEFLRPSVNLVKLSTKESSLLRSSHLI